MAEKARDILEMIWNFPRFFRVFSPAGGIFRNSEPVWCPHCFLCLLFPGKGKWTAFSFCFSQKKTPGKRKETGENFRMVSPDPFYRPEPCSGLAAYGSRKCTIEFVGADEGIDSYKVRREVELRGFTTRNNRPREAQSPVHLARRGCRPLHFGGCSEYIA